MISFRRVIKSNLLLIRLMIFIIIIVTMLYLKTACSLITILGISLMCPILALQLLLINHPALGTFTLSIVIPMLIVLIFGRAICGWICPLGLARSLINSKLRLKRLVFHISGKAILVLPMVSLVTLLFVSYLTNYPIYCLVCPLGAFYRVILGLSVMSLDMSLLLYLVVSLFIISLTNIWCLGLCPHGALYMILGRFKLLRVVNDESKCIHCNLCLRTCPLRLQIQKPTEHEYASCTTCLTCLTKCPRDSLTVKVSFTNKMDDEC